MATAKEIRESCEREIAELQRVCEHSEKKWMVYAWAPGHLTSKICLICLACEKELDSETLPTDWLQLEPITVDDKGVWHIHESRLDKYLKEKNQALVGG